MTTLAFILGEAGGPNYFGWWSLPFSLFCYALFFLLPMGCLVVLTHKIFSLPPVEAGCRPADPKCRLVTRYWMTPASMPKPATPKPSRQLMRSPRSEERRVGKERR